MGHLVLRPVAGPHALRGQARVADVAGRVVVAPPHHEARAPGQRDGLRVAIDRLPVQVPVPDVDEPLPAPVRQDRLSLDVPAEVVGVRVDAEHVHRHRQLELVGHHEIRGPGRDVEGPVVLELHEHREPGGLHVGEVETDLRPHGFGLARGLEVHVQDEVGPRVEAPRHVRRLLAGRAARLPEEEVAVRIEALGFDRDFHAGESRLRIEGVAPPRGLRPVDQHVRVMRDPPIVEADLERPHEARGRDGNRQHEVAEDVRAARRERPGLGQGEHEVGRAERPGLRELRRRREVGGIALRGPRVHPLSQERDLPVAEPALPLEPALSRLGRPWRHVARRRHRRDLLRALPRAVVGEQAERTGPARTMAGCAVGVHDRGDVLVERDRRLRVHVGGDDHARGRQRPQDSPDHSRSARKHPTAGVVSRGTAFPDRTAWSASSRSWVVGAARIRSKAT